MLPLGPSLTADRRTSSPLTAAVVLGAAAAAGTIAFLLLLADGVARAFRHGDGPGELAGVLVAMGVALAVRAACQVVADRCAQRSSARLRRDVRHRLTDHLVAVGPTGVRPERTGELAATVGPAVDALDPYVTSFLPTRALAAIVPVMVLGTILVIDPWTTLILLFTGPMLLLLLAVIGRRTRALTQRRFDELGWLRSFYLDLLRGLGTLKAFGRSEEAIETVGSVSARHASTTMEVLRTAFQTSLVMEWAATAATALVAVQVSFRLVERDLAFGPALAVLVLTPEFFLPFRRLALEYHAGQSGTAAIERITAALALPVAPGVATARATATATSPAPATPVTVGGLSLHDVSFSYAGAPTPALRGVSLHVEAGETVALVGPSGAGKSTVARLVLRFLEPDAGSIAVAGAPLAAIDLRSWRRSVAWVPQDPTIFAGTVVDNIRLAAPDAPIERVRDAAAAAGAGAFVDDLPDGFDTVLGERGLRLSGGQRQRLAIARAVLADAPFVVLDEFTAHLDPDTEADVLDRVGALLAGRTAIVIAHRPATIAAADRVVRLDAGRVVAEAGR